MPRNGPVETHESLEERRYEDISVRLDGSDETHESIKTS